MSRRLSAADLDRIERDLAHCAPNGQHWQVSHGRALLAEVRALTAERDEARTDRDTFERMAGGGMKAVKSLAAERDRLREVSRAATIVVRGIDIMGYHSDADVGRLRALLDGRQTDA